MSCPETTNKLSLEEILSDEALENTPSWWAALAPLSRARGRWCFHEPDGLPQPRQRARCWGVVDVKDEQHKDEEVERHNKSSLFKVQAGPHTEGWKNFALKTTNQLYQLPMPQAHNHDQVISCTQRAR